MISLFGLRLFTEQEVQQMLSELRAECSSVFSLVDEKQEEIDALEKHLEYLNGLESEKQDLTGGMEALVKANALQADRIKELEEKLSAANETIVFLSEAKVAEAKPRPARQKKTVRQL